MIEPRDRSDSGRVGPDKWLAVSQGTKDRPQLAQHPQDQGEHDRDEDHVPVEVRAGPNGEFQESADPLKLRVLDPE